MSHGFRTHTCGDLREEQIGQKVILKGWVDTRRDLGGLVFIDLRDRYGLTQVVFTPQDNEAAHSLADRLRNEFVISVEGVVDNRSAETVNKKLPTGSVEVRATELEILNASEALPFQVSSHEKKHAKVNEELRLKYRYLDLRRPHLAGNMIKRHKFYQIVRKHFSEHDFVEVETPVLMKSTPEGARDYLVPSRVHPGEFYALPQSPQTYKQILMVSGMDRYFQIVKCFRDEDLRADRQPEFTQVDVEISFATQDLIFENIESLMSKVWMELKGKELSLPFRRMSYHDAISKYGSDKPDLRFGLEINTITDVFADCPFRVFADMVNNGGSVLGVVVPGEGERGRGAMDRLDKDVVRKRIGAGGLIYIKISNQGEVNCSVKAEVLPESFVQETIEKTGAGNGDLILILAGKGEKVYDQMGRLRLHMANELGLVSPDPSGPDEFLWVTEFPMLEWDEDNGRYHAMHHPFTSPLPEDEHLLDSDPSKAKARAYDLVLNGSEIGGGSIRIHSMDLQSKIFTLLGIDKEEAERRFGFLLNAFRYGAPPHGGIALGVDRIVMLLTGATSLREVIAFPKTQSATELMVNSPDVVDDHQLKDLHIQLDIEEED